MSPCRMLLIAPLLLLALAACDRSQPSGVPDTTALPATPAPVQPVEQAPAAPVADAAPVEAAPPPLDSPIPPYAKTGYPDCDDYIESYR